MPAIAKLPEDRQRRNTLAVLPDAPVPVGFVIPLPPARLSESLRVLWGRLWLSPVAQLFDPVSDYPSVARLFELYELGARVDGMLDQADDFADGVPRETSSEEIAAAIAARETFNSTAGLRMRIASETRMLEAQLGLSPRSRVVLGLTVLAGRRAGLSLDDAVDAADDNE